MGKKERKIINKVLSELPDNERLFRINAGMGWAGKIVKHTGKFIVLADPFPFHGAPTGWPDLAGWETVKITADMVGETVAIFKGCEVKATGGLNKDQKAFKRLLKKMGGIFKTIRPDNQEPA